jgi:hypothetical protein
MLKGHAFRSAVNFGSVGIFALLPFKIVFRAIEIERQLSVFVDLDSQTTTCRGPVSLRG